MILFAFEQYADIALELENAIGQLQPGMVSTCDTLSKAGVEEIDVMVAHDLFPGTRWKGLYRLGVTRIFCTDSVPLPAGVDGQSIVRLSIIPLLAKELGCRSVRWQDRR